MTENYLTVFGGSEANGQMITVMPRVLPRIGESLTNRYYPANETAFIYRIVAVSWETNTNGQVPNSKVGEIVINNHFIQAKRTEAV